MQPVQTALVRDSHVYRACWMFYGRSALTVILPFVLIAFMNARIVKSLKEGPRGLRSALLFATVGHKVNRTSDLKEWVKWVKQ